jgi:hypothetical protein
LILTFDFDICFVLKSARSKRDGGRETISTPPKFSSSTSYGIPSTDRQHLKIKRRQPLNTTITPKTWDNPPPSRKTPSSKNHRQFSRPNNKPHSSENEKRYFSIIFPLISNQPPTQARLTRLRATERRLASTQPRKKPTPSDAARKPSALEEASRENKGWRDADAVREWRDFQ